MSRPVHKKLILPGDVQRSGSGLTIMVPRGYEDDDGPAPTMICRVPVNAEDLCLAMFYPGEERAFQKHCGECAHRHRDAIEERKNRLEIFREDAWDPEVAEHMRKVGQRMIREGRLVVKPHERAGF